MYNLKFTLNLMERIRDITDSLAILHSLLHIKIATTRKVCDLFEYTLPACWKGHYFFRKEDWCSAFPGAFIALYGGLGTENYFDTRKGAWGLPAYCQALPIISLQNTRARS